MIEAATIGSQTADSHPRMANEHTPWTDRLVKTIPFRIGLVLLTTLLAAAACLLAFLVNHSLQPVVLRLASLALVGLVAGFAARLILRENTAMLRLLSAWSALIGALFLLGVYTDGYLGFDLSSLPALAPHWDWLGQLALGGLAAWLATQAWGAEVKIAPKGAKRGKTVKPPRNTGAKPKKPPQPVKHSPASRSSSGAKAKATRQPRVSKPALHVPDKSRRLDISRRLDSGRKQLLDRLQIWGSRANELASDTSQRLGGLVSQAQVKIRGRWRPVGKRVHLSHGRSTRRVTLTRPSQVKLVGKAENRCPYCLEVVEPDDPRGVKICPICHTYHHADCWAVTGTCQVPHYQE
jgi:hypothetical protein